MINQELAKKAKPYATLKKKTNKKTKTKNIYSLSINRGHKIHKASACYQWLHAYNMFQSFQAIKPHMLLTAEASEHLSVSNVWFFLPPPPPLLSIKTMKFHELNRSNCQASSEQEGWLVLSIRCH